MRQTVDGNKRKKEKPAHYGRKRLKIALIMLSLTDIWDILRIEYPPHRCPPHRYITSPS